MNPQRGWRHDCVLTEHHRPAGVRTATVTLESILPGKLQRGDVVVVDPKVNGCRTVERRYLAFGGIMVGVEWSDGQVSTFVPWQHVRVVK